MLMQLKGRWPSPLCPSIIELDPEGLEWLHKAVFCFLAFLAFLDHGGDFLQQATGSGLQGQIWMFGMVDYPTIHLTFPSDDCPETGGPWMRCQRP